MLVAIDGPFNWLIRYQKLVGTDKSSKIGSDTDSEIDSDNLNSVTSDSDVNKGKLKTLVLDTNLNKRVRRSVLETDIGKIYVFINWSL